MDRCAVMSGPNQWRILVVDDEPDIHETYALLLGCSEITEDGLRGLQLLSDENAGEPEQSDFLMDHAYNGEDGFRMVQEAIEAEAPYAVILLDMRMSNGWDGMKAAEIINTVDSAVRIIFVSAYMDHSLNELRERMSGDFQYLEKPVDQDLLRETVISEAQKWDLL
jgi:CheY-like chemotaxis protein